MTARTVEAATKPANIDLRLLGLLAALRDLGMRRCAVKPLRANSILANVMRRKPPVKSSPFEERGKGSVWSNVIVDWAKQPAHNPM